MKFHQATADFFVPDGEPRDEALKRITHLGIGAHQDDLEFMAFHGILQCYENSQEWFGAVTCSDGGRSSRAGQFAHYSDLEIREARRNEQKRAASAGEYGVMIQLDYPSHAITAPSDAALENDLREILLATSPKVVYTHNPADKHETHVGVVLAALRAMRGMPKNLRPTKVIGCEVWRDLDWMPDEEKVIMDVSAGDHLAAKLNALFQTQIAGGKRYDQATIGRRSANATFLDPRQADGADQVIFGIDLTPLVTDESRDITEFVSGFIERFHDDVRRKLLQERSSR